eukprot:jgi/Mesvir1/5821/Mv06324-RA.1
MLAEGQDAPGPVQDTILSATLQFLKSPPFVGAVHKFVVEHCMTFDSDENKLAYTKLHQDFVNIVFDLIEKFLDSSGVPFEQFAAACEHGVEHGGGDAFVFQQIIAVDDFSHFKDMMRRMYERMKHCPMHAQKRIQEMATTGQAKTPNSPTAASGCPVPAQGLPRPGSRMERPASRLA